MFVMHLQAPQTSGVIAQIPWVLAAIGGLAGTVSMAKKWLMCVAISLLTGSQVLLGHPQSLWFALTAELLFALFLFLGQAPPGGRRVAVVVGIALGLGIGAVESSPHLPC